MKLLYVISGRSFKGKSKGRKITSMIDFFHGISTLNVVFGGDLMPSQDTKLKSTFQGVVKSAQQERGFFMNSVSELRDIIHDVKLFFHLKKIKEKPDIIIERSCRLHISPLIFSKMNGSIYVHEWIDNLFTLYNSSLLKWLGKFMERLKLKYSDTIVVPNGVIKNDLIADGVDGQKITVCYNSIDTEVFYPMDIERNKFTVTYIGSFAFYHDIFCLIDAIELVQSKYPNLEIDYKFYGDGLNYAEAKERVEKASLKNVQFYGRVGIDDVPLTINESDICVLPGSTDIICPIKVMEFMGCGKASIVPDYECNKEVVTNGVDGILFSPHDSNDLAEKIYWSYQNPEKLVQIGQNAMKTSRDRFTWEKTWGQIVTKN